MLAIKKIIGCLEKWFSFVSHHSSAHQLPATNHQPPTTILKLFILIAALSYVPQAAFAFDIPTTEPTTIGSDGTICPSSDSAAPSKGFVVRMVPCIRNATVYATTKIFSPIAAITAKATIVASTLAVVLWGISLMAGQPTQISKTGIMLLIKIAVVATFASTYQELFPRMLNIVESLMNTVAKPATSMIWKGTNCKATLSGSDAQVMAIFAAIDCYLDSLIGGIFNPLDIKNGLVGFLYSCLFSGIVGFIIGAMGFYLIWISLSTIARTIFIYMTAIIAFSLMIVISPIIAPLILFKQTQKRYFNQWLNLLINFMVQPVFVVGYLTMFLMAFDVTIIHGTKSLFYSVAGSEATTGGSSSDPQIGKWLNDSGSYGEVSLGAEGVKIDPEGAKKETKAPSANDLGVEKIGGYAIPKDGINNAIEYFGAGTVAKALNYFRTDFPAQAVDWDKLAKKAGYSDVDKYKLNLFLSFLMSVIVIYIFYILLDYIPFIGSGLINEAPSRVTLGGGNLAAPGSSNSAKGSR